MRLRFDRGTLLVEEPLAAWRFPALPWVAWDRRVRQYRASGFRYRRLVHELRRVGLEVEDEVRPALAGPASWDEVPLRPRQAAALASWKLAGGRGLVVARSGGRRLALAAMAQTALRALCLVPTSLALARWHFAIARFYRGEIGLVGGGEHRLSAVTLGTFAGANREMAALGNRFDLLVVEGAHHLGAGLRAEALEYSTAPFRLGLTATLPSDARITDDLRTRIGSPVRILPHGGVARLALRRCAPRGRSTYWIEQAEARWRRS